MTPRVCVITGAASGIGRGIAKRFVADGWSVVGFDINEENLAAVAAELSDVGTFIPVLGDVASRDDLTTASTVASETGLLTCWINNAGFNIEGNIHQVEPDAYERGIAVNLGGMFWGTATAVRSFLETETAGNIINISSTTALHGYGNLAAYAMCKGGIISLSKEVASEYIGNGIRCNVIAPGVIDTGIHGTPADLGRDPLEEERKLRERCPIGRIGTPRDVAEAALFLSSDETAGFITGQVMVVDGGCTTLARGT